VQADFVIHGLKRGRERVAVLGEIGRRAILSSAASVVIHYARRLRSPGSGDRASILRVMQRISLDALATQQLQLAAAHGGRPAADTVVGGHERVLRQTVVGMIKGTELGEHNNPRRGDGARAARSGPPDIRRRALGGPVR
jgi:hypothetical protein